MSATGGTTVKWYDGSSSLLGTIDTGGIKITPTDTIVADRAYAFDDGTWTDASGTYVFGMAAKQTASTSSLDLSTPESNSGSDSVGWVTIKARGANAAHSTLKDAQIVAYASHTTAYAKVYADGGVAINSTNASPADGRLDVDFNSNTAALRLRGTAETAEIADVFIDSNGALNLSTTAGSATYGYINVTPGDSLYGLVLRESDDTGGSWANFSVIDTTVDYLNISINANNSTVGLVVDDDNQVGIGTTTPETTLQVAGVTTIDAADGAADNVYVLNALNRETTSGRNFGAYILGGSNSSDYALFLRNIGLDDLFTVTGAGDAWVKGNMSFLSYTDRTPFFAGDALAALRGVRGTAHGEIDHASLPQAARRQVRQPDGRLADERDLGGMMSILVRAVQQLDAKVATLEATR